MTAPVYLIDASIYLFRSFFSLPERWHDDEGQPLNVVVGYGRFLLELLRRYQPQQIACAFDESLGTCFRNDIYSDYKLSRAYADESLLYQFELCKALTELLGVGVFAHDRYEADDLIASLAAIARSRKQAVTIVSRDKDLGQLLCAPDDTLQDFYNDKTFKRSNFKEHFGVTSDQLIDYLSLVGDPVDDVPGIPGIGKKTAILLLEQFDSVDQLYAELDSLKKSSIRGAKSHAQRLVDNEPILRVAQRLVTLKDDIGLSSRWDELNFSPAPLEEVIAFLDEVGLEKVFAKNLEKCEWYKH